MPGALASSPGRTRSLAGVPDYTEWIQRAVGASLSSAWLGGPSSTLALLEAQAATLVAATPGEVKNKSISTASLLPQKQTKKIKKSHRIAQQPLSSGLVADIEGLEAASMLRRGCAAAQLGAAALQLPPSRLGQPAYCSLATAAAAANVADAVVTTQQTEDNDLLRVYELVLVETQVRSLSLVALIATFMIISA